MARYISDLLTYTRVSCDVQKQLDHLRPHLRYFERQSRGYISGKIKLHISIVPFVARGLLEGGLTALLFRTDYFRGATLARFQVHPEFDFTRQQSISVAWTGDIIPPDETKNDLWAPKTKPESVSRALLSQYSDNIIWIPAINRVKDYLDSKGIILQFPTILNDESEKVISRLRGESRQLYSFWSKGVHCEAFSMGPTSMDPLTCVDRLQRTCDVVSELALLSQFAHAVVGNATPQYALSAYSQMKEILHG